MALQAAFGKVKITPEEYAPLQGYDPSVHIADPERDILDDLYARVLLLDDGSRRNAVISVDCCLTNEMPFLAHDPSGKGQQFRYLDGTFPEGTRQEWADAAGMDASSVSVHATHTHSAPAYIGKKYTARITSKIEELLQELRPVRLKAASGHCTISVNRRPHLQHNNELPIDRSLNLLWFETEDGVPVGAVVNCAVHPTLLMNPFGRVTTEFVGLAMNELEACHGNSFISLFIQGFSGDVGPFNHYRMETEDTYPLVQQMGHAFFQDIQRIVSKLSLLASGPLRSEESKVGLPTRDGYYQPVIESTIHGLRIGELIVFSTSNEVFNGYVGEISRHSPFTFNLFSGVANGYYGYLPTKAAFGDGLGGYEMNTTPYCDQASDIFVQHAVALIRRLHEDTE